jgi:hypothetical protein
MNTSIKNFSIGTLAATAIIAASMGTANAGVFFYRTAVVTPVVVAPVIAAPVIVAPVVVAPVYIPTCRLVAFPVMNAYTGFTYIVTRRVCN